MNIQAVASYTSQGLFPVQEDYLFIEQNENIFAIADGFGGDPAGFLAAKTACDAVRRFLIKEARDWEATLPFELRPYFSLAGNVLFNSIIFANKKVMENNKNKHVHQRGGTSLLAAYLDHELLAIASVGSCEAWLLRNESMVSLNRPRTYSNLMDPFGLGQGIQQKNIGSIPLMALGYHPSLEPEIFENRLQKGDWLFLHSDGITPLDHTRLLVIQKQGLSPHQSAEVYLKDTRDSGLVREDNATFLLIIF